MVVALAAAMAEGRWAIGCAPVVVARGGRVLDGAQRLRACVAARTAFRTLLAEEVDQDLLPAQARHDFAQVLHDRGLPHAQALADAAMLVARHEDGTLGHAAHPPGWSTLAATLQAHPALTTAAARAAPLPEAIRAAFLYLAGREDTAALETLLDQMHEGPPAAHAPAPAPGRLLAAALLHRSAAAPLTPRSVRLLALCVLAWQAVRQDSRPQRLIWKPAHGFPFLRTPPTPPAAPRGAGVRQQLIHPAEAAAWLASARPGRPEPGPSAPLLAAMRQGRWALDPQPICLDVQGRLLDGRRRLMAVCELGGAIEAVVARGLPAPSIPAPPRLSAGVTALAQLLWAEEERRLELRRVKATPQELDGLLLQHPRLPGFATFGRRAEALVIASVAGYVAYVAEREDAERASAFWDGLLTNVSEAPLFLQGLRRRLERTRATGASREAVLRVLLRGWQSFRRRNVG